MNKLNEEQNTPMIQMFNSPMFGEIRTIITNEKTKEVWFVLNEICKVLGYQNPRDAKQKHLRDRDVTKCDIGVVTGKKKDGSDAIQNVEHTLINESGLYRLIMKSRAKNAEKFQDWVTDEVLPTIRRTGGYVEEELMEKMYNDADFALNWLTKYREEHQKVKELQAKVEQDAPKIGYYEDVLDTRNAMNISIIAKDLGMSGRKLNQILNELGIQYKRGETWYLYKMYEGNGYVDYRTNLISHKDSDDVETKHTMVWTEKGREFIYNTLKNNDLI